MSDSIDMEEAQACFDTALFSEDDRALVMPYWLRLGINNSGVVV